MNRKSIRPNNRVFLGGALAVYGRVIRTGRHKQGGAWVRTYTVQVDETAARRRVFPHLVVRPEAA